jgi:hypothetical protein
MKVLDEKAAEPNLGAPDDLGRDEGTTRRMNAPEAKPEAQPDQTGDGKGAEAGAPSPDE